MFSFDLQTTNQQIVKEKARQWMWYAVIGMMFLVGLLILCQLSPISIFAQGALEQAADTINSGGKVLANAQDTKTATTMINSIVNVVCIIVMIVGGLFCLVGIVKFAIAHAENQGPEQQRATLMLATGIILIILPLILKQIDFDGVATSAVVKYAN